MEDRKDTGTAVAVFNDRSDAQRAIAELRQAGFSEDQIGVTARDAGDQQALKADDDGHSHGNRAAKGAATGLAAGAGVGALWGLGILAGVIPAIGPAIAGGTLGILLSSAGAGAATAGLAGALIGLGIPEDEAHHYEEEFRAGRIVVTVAAKDRYAQAMSILRSASGDDIEQSRSRRASSAARDNERASGTRTLQAREEEVHVRKTPVQTGEVEVRKETRTERRTIDVPVQKDELVIERHAVKRHPADGPMDDRAETVRVPLSEERVQVEKRPVVTEEVTVGKRRAESNEEIDTTVRKEEIKVDKRGRVDVRDDRR
jgi:uncharacterized protein (TIGR02271 family)